MSLFCVCLGQATSVQGSANNLNTSIGYQMWSGFEEAREYLSRNRPNEGSLPSESIANHRSWFAREIQYPQLDVLLLKLGHNSKSHKEHTGQSSPPPSFLVLTPVFRNFTMSLWWLRCLLVYFRPLCIYRYHSTFFQKLSPPLSYSIYNSNTAKKQLNCYSQE